nr:MULTISPECIES: hypothetical protein [Haloarcula]
MIRRLLETLKANLIYVVVGALVTGLAAGQVAGESTRGLLQTAVVPVLFLMIYPMMINIDLDEIRNLRAHARPVALSLVVNFLFTVSRATFGFDGCVFVEKRATQGINGVPVGRYPPIGFYRYSYRNL